MTGTEHWFGLRPNVSPLPGLYWGARAIYTPYQGIDLLWDRQQYNDSTEALAKAREALWTWISDKGLARLKKELVRRRIEARDSELVTVVDRRHTIIANPNRSHGYLYLGAWRNDAKREEHQ